MPVLNTRIIDRTNGPGYGKNVFEADAPEAPTLDEVAKAQHEAGYHPAGYGGPDRVTYADGKVRWTCSRSCD